MMAAMSFLLIGLLGGFNGLRTMTPIAVLCWFAWMQRVSLMGWRSFAANLIAVVIFTAAALGEIYGDKLPTTPSRLRPVGIGARAVFASLCAVLLAQPLGLPVIAAGAAGVAGALLGAYGGWFVRTRSVAALKCADWKVAVVEDTAAILGAFFVLNSLADTTKHVL
jgi:uncharacterized membrane protein